jgi:hypothetical protein
VIPKGRVVTLGKDAAAVEAIRRLRDLLGGVAETTELCGLPTATVREILSRRPGAAILASPAGTATSRRPGLPPR